MKHLTFFLVIFLCAATMKSQDIINRTGTNGQFIIENANGETEFVFKSNVGGQPELIIAKNPYSFSPDLYELNIQSTFAGPLVNFASFSSFGTGPVLYFQKARGNNPPANVNQGDAIGAISFSAYAGSFKESASIQSVVTAPGTTRAAAEIIFTTSAVDTDPTTRFKVKSNGAIHFAPLDADPTPAEAGDVYYNGQTNKLRLFDGTNWVDLN